MLRKMKTKQRLRLAGRRLRHTSHLRYFHIRLGQSHGFLHVVGRAVQYPELVLLAPTHTTPKGRRAHRVPNVRNDHVAAKARSQHPEMPPRMPTLTRKDRSSNLEHVTTAFRYGEWLFLVISACRMYVEYIRLPVTTRPRERCIAYVRHEIGHKHCMMRTQHDTRIQYTTRTARVIETSRMSQQKREKAHQQA